MAREKHGLDTHFLLHGPSKYHWAAGRKVLMTLYKERFHPISASGCTCGVFATSNLSSCRVSGEGRELHFRRLRTNPSIGQQDVRQGFRLLHERVFRGINSSYVNASCAYHLVARRNQGPCL